VRREYRGKRNWLKISRMTKIRKAAIILIQIDSSFTLTGVGLLCFYL